MLYVSLDCPLLVFSSVVSNVYLLSLSCVLCIQCCMCLWIVHYWLPLQFSLTFTCCLCPVSCVSNVVCVSGLSIIGSPSVVSNVYLLSLSCVLCMLYVSLDCPLLVFSSVVSNVYLSSLSCVLCIQCCMCLWIVHYWLPLRFSLTFTCCLCPVSCVLNVVCVSGLSIIGFLFSCL